MAETTAKVQNLNIPGIPLVGNAAGNAEYKTLPSGKTVVEFSIYPVGGFNAGMNLTYMKDGEKKNGSLTVTIWDEDLQEYAVKKVVKGARVELMGGLVVNTTAEGRTYLSFSPSMLNAVKVAKAGEGTGTPAASKGAPPAAPKSGAAPKAPAAKSPSEDPMSLFDEYFGSGETA